MTKLARWLDSQDATLAAIAQRIGVHRVSLYRYAVGKVMPRPGVCARIEEVTGGRVRTADLASAYRKAGSAR